VVRKSETETLSNEIIKANRMPAIIPARIRGSVTWRKTLIGGAHRELAASSRTASSRVREANTVRIR